MYTYLMYIIKLYHYNIRRSISKLNKKIIRLLAKINKHPIAGTLFKKPCKKEANTVRPYNKFYQFKYKPLLPVITGQTNAQLLNNLFVHLGEHYGAMHFAVLKIIELFKGKFCVFVRNGGN